MDNGLSNHVEYIIPPYGSTFNKTEFNFLITGFGLILNDGESVWVAVICRANSVRFSGI